MKTTKMLLAAAAPLALLATPADAAIFSYTLTGAYAGDFTIDSDDLPPSIFNTASFEVAADGTLDGRTGAQIIQFNTLANDGGLTLGDSFANLFGAQLFTGTTAAPTLLTGTFTLFLDGDTSQAVTLNVAAVPEPATWAMMIAGFGAVGIAARRRRVTVASA